MSETTSSPSVHLHPISPSSESSFSSTDSAPRSDPTSDEQPDLGAFTTVLREWTHLQPGPRIPVQIRSATSSTTPTFQPEQSVAGSDHEFDRGRRRNSRTSNRSGLSTQSSFTRPPSSSVQPEGSTVWNQALIASYLNSATPSNDVITEEDEESDGLRDSEYTPSPPSRPSTALTVEIASEVDFPSFDGSRDSSRNELDPSPYPDHAEADISLPVPLGSDGQRLDSRETAHRDDELEEGSLPSGGSHGQDTSPTSRDSRHRHVFYTETLSSQSNSRYQSQAEVTSVQLQSQAHPATTIANSSAESLFLPIQDSGSSVTLSSTSSASVRQILPSTSNNDTVSARSSGSTSTLITALFNRSRIPLPPRTTSDSSVMTTGSAQSSDFSLISYQLPETPSITNDEERDSSRHSSGLPPLRPQLNHPPVMLQEFASSSTSLPSSSVASASLSLKTQKSVDSSSSSGSHPNFASAAVEQASANLLPLSHPLGVSHISSLSSDGSPLPNPYSPMPGPRPEGPIQADLVQSSGAASAAGRITVRDFDIVNDLGTPSEQTSELGPFQSLTRSTRTDILPVDDIEEDDEVVPGLRRDLRQSQEILVANRVLDKQTLIGS